MSTIEVAAHDVPASAAPGPFGSILCAVDGGRGGDLAVLQAVVLAAPHATLRFVAVGDPGAFDALHRAERLARGAGLEAHGELLHESAIAETLLREARGHDLLVAGSHPRSRAGGILLGDVAAALAHRCERPLLIAAPADSVAAFPKRIVVAIDGAGDPGGPLELAIAIARAHVAQLQVVHVPHGDGPAERHKLALATARILVRLGEEPVVQTPKGPPAEGIAHAARAAGASLLVLGHRGLGGVRALGSVGERVVAAAPCSVLLVPGHESEGSSS